MTQKTLLEVEAFLTGGDHTGETLVDRKLLVLAYAYAGTFTAMGAWAGTLLTLYFYNVNLDTFFKEGFSKNWQQEHRILNPQQEKR